MELWKLSQWQNTHVSCKLLTIKHLQVFYLLKIKDINSEHKLNIPMSCILQLSSVVLNVLVINKSLRIKKPSLYYNGFDRINAIFTPIIIDYPWPFQQDWFSRLRLPIIICLSLFHLQWRCLFHWQWHMHLFSCDNFSYQSTVLKKEFISQ